MYYVLSAVLRTLFHLIYSLILSQFETWEMLNSQNLSNLGKFTKLVSVVIQSQLSDSKSPLSINVLHQFSKKEAVALRYYSQGRLYRRQQRVTTFRNKKTKAGHSRKEKGGAGVEKFFFSFGAGDRHWLLVAIYYLCNCDVIGQEKWYINPRPSPEHLLPSAGQIQKSWQGELGTLGRTKP